MKLLVQDRVESIREMQAQFDEEISRLAALSSQDELEAEKIYHQQKSESASRTIEASRHLVGKLEERNASLKTQNELLSEKVAVLEKLLESERAARKRAEEEFLLNEKIRALADLLEPKEKDISAYFELYKDQLEPLRTKKTSQPLSTSRTIENPSKE